MSGSPTTVKPGGASVTIRVRSHHFLIKDPSTRVRQVIREFIKPLIKWDTRWVRGRPVREISAVYAVANKARTEYRFPINFLPSFIEALKRAEFKDEEIKQINDRAGRGQKVVQKFIDGFEVREHQIDPLDYLKDPTDDRTKLLELQTGQGKLQPLDSAIKIPGGWSTMGEMQVGTIITAWDGTPAKVNGVFPQGKKQVYRITFADGRSVEAGAEHLWKIYQDTCKIVTTRELIGLMRDNIPVYIPLNKSEVIDDVFLEVPPFTLGVEIALKKKTGSIHPDYLNASTRQRYELLLGLLYRSSTEIKPDEVFSTSSEELAKDVQYLVRSLGGISHLVKEVFQYKVTVRLNRPMEDLKLQVLLITPTRITETQCISIDHPDKLYITDDFIVTHNTATTLKAVEEAGRAAIYFMPAKYLVNWAEACEKFHDPDTLNLFIDGSSDIKKLIKAKLAKTAPDYANYFISSNTFDRFIKMYERDPKRFRREYRIGIDQFFKLLGIDTVVVDEAHEFLHFNVKLWCYTNVYRTISLSGTYETKDRLEHLIMTTLHPLDQRREKEAYNKYSDSYCWLYEVINPEYVKTTNPGDEKYSHNAFERYFLQPKDRRERYFTMLHEMLRVEYFETRKEGQSVIMYCAAVDTCMWFSEWLKKRYPNEKITYFISGSDFEDDFLNSDIVISTQGKAGTALDKPGLCTVIQTIPQDGNRGFKQAFGRIREIKGQRTRFAMLTASNLEKPMRYFKEKYQLLESMSLTVSRRVYPHRI